MGVAEKRLAVADEVLIENYFEYARLRKPIQLSDSVIGQINVLKKLEAFGYL